MSYSTARVKRHVYYIPVRDCMQYGKPPFLIVSKEIPHCPFCGKSLKFAHHADRHEKLAGGTMKWYLIEVWKCDGCTVQKMHRALPDFLAPYKHYNVDIITDVIDDVLESGEIDHFESGENSQFQSVKKDQSQKPDGFSPPGSFSNHQHQLSSSREIFTSCSAFH